MLDDRHTLFAGLCARLFELDTEKINPLYNIDKALILPPNVIANQSKQIFRDGSHLAIGHVLGEVFIVLVGVCGIGWILERREVYANGSIWQINDDDIALRIDQRAKIAVAIKRNIFRVREISLRLDLTNGARN
jgi:hypothetical protein